MTVAGAPGAGAPFSWQDHPGSWPTEPWDSISVCAAGPGILHELTGVIARHRGDITSVEIVERGRETSRVYFEIDLRRRAPTRSSPSCARCRSSSRSTVVETFQRVYGKRIIIMGGGAQVGQVAIGAISEADRHNIRGEHISVDTIPLVGEQPLADAVRAVTRLPRAKALVLAGSLMGGEIEHGGARGARAGACSSSASTWRAACPTPPTSW